MHLTIHNSIKTHIQVVYMCTSKKLLIADCHYCSGNKLKVRKIKWRCFKVIRDKLITSLITKKKSIYKPDSWSSHKTHSFDMNEMENTWKNATYSYNSTEVFITLFCLNYFKYFVWIITSMQERNPLDYVRLSSALNRT